jgi:hypothetical protein
MLGVYNGPVGLSCHKVVQVIEVTMEYVNVLNAKRGLQKSDIIRGRIAEKTV